MSSAVWFALFAGALALFFLTRSGGSTANLAEFLDRGALILDVRTSGEFQTGHILNALNIPLDQLSDRLHELNPGPVVVYCASGMRSRRARAILDGAGFEVLDMSRLGNFPADHRS